MTGGRCFRFAKVRGLLAIGLGLLLIGVGGSAAQDEKKSDKPQGSGLEESLKKARVSGKYAMLIGQIKVDEDREDYGEFREAGLQRFRRYKGHNDVPAGYWVYVHPYWYIWRDLTTTPTAKRAWGPEQAIGEPDTPLPGDFGTAWASLTPDGQSEWLMVEFGEPVDTRTIQIHESWNPGALTRVTAYRLDGREVEIWNGTDPSSPDKERGISEIKPKTDLKIARLRLHFDSREVRGWNEIDAVALVDEAGKKHWATAAEASSTTATGPEQAVLQALIVSQQRIRNLEEEVIQLRKAVEEMRKAAQKDK